MKRIVLFLMAFCFTSFYGFAQLRLQIEIVDLRNSEGQVMLEFNDENDQVLKGLSAEIMDNKSVFVIEDLEAGMYAFKYFHDENKDSKLNTTFIGMPKEGCGFSNNAMGKLGPPQFQKMLFELTRSDTLRCTPKYMKK